jgi:CubicO group peptidase (beta-lactamase class C family)
MSMQFTAAAILRLVDSGSLRLDDHVTDLIPGIEGADKISIRDLLTERSGLPDINALPGYDDVLQHHQTPASLVSKIEGQPLLFLPGSKFLHGEHSAYNLLALNRRNASVYTTAADEARWVDALFRGNQISTSSRATVLDIALRVGYGWFKGTNNRFGEAANYMNGRAPGFASFVLFLPRAQTRVVVLSNVYSSATTTIGYDIASLSLGSSREPFRLREPAPDPCELKNCTGVFRFGPGF